MDFQNPDDPFKTEIKWQEDGSVVVVVSCEALADDPELRAECERRGKLIVEQFTAFVQGHMRKDT